MRDMLRAPNGPHGRVSSGHERALAPCTRCSTWEGDGAGDMVQAVATRSPDGHIAIVAWNGTVDVTKAAGDRLLDRSINPRA
jgi:hypothetical protein